MIHCSCVFFRDNITIQPLKGCVKKVKVDSNSEVFDEEVGISLGCPTEFFVSLQPQLDPCISSGVRRVSSLYVLLLTFTSCP